jgi:hypothetical protein
MTDVFMLFLGFLLGVLVERLQTGVKERRSFRNVVSAILDAIQKADGNGTPTLYKESIDKLMPEIARVKEDIWLWKRSAFQAAWDKYCDEGQIPLDVRINETRPGELSAYKLGHFEEGRKRLEALLEDLIKYAS